MASTTEFVLERLENIGLKHVFGIAGDYILPFFGNLAKSKKIKVINNTDEMAAGFAADGYARVNGIGCVVVTYNVGALKLCNPVAGAYAERSPIIVISGSPGVKERSEVPMHHMIGSFDCQREVFKNITCAQAILDNPTTAGYEVDRVFEALKYHKQPVYIELPRDMAAATINYDVYTLGTPKVPETDYHNLEDALTEVINWLESCEKPVILAGVEVARYGFGKELIRFAEKYNIPIAATLLGKSVVDEEHPLYLGVYAGSNSSEESLIEAVENSDCLLVCGEIITEATFGYRPSKIFEKREMITCTVGELKVRKHNYPNVSFVDFCKALFKTEITPKQSPKIINLGKESKTFEVQEDQKLTNLRIFEKINSILNDDMIVVADVGDALLGASELLTMRNANSFFGPAFYLSMGFAIPASLGIQLANSSKRPIIIVGDGAFQMSCSEISTIVKHKLNPIIFVLNNKGYTTERMILDGEFNNIVDWRYHKIIEMIGGGQGFCVEDEKALESAVNTALSCSDVPCIINCIIEPLDISPALRRICESLTKKLKGGN